MHCHHLAELKFLKDAQLGFPLQHQHISVFIPTSWIAQWVPKIPSLPWHTQYTNTQDQHHESSEHTAHIRAVSTKSLLSQISSILNNFRFNYFPSNLCQYALSCLFFVCLELVVLLLWLLNTKMTGMGLQLVSKSSIKALQLNVMAV